MPLPIVEPPCDLSVGRRELGIPAGFVFLFAFDFLSGFQRKNPLGLIAAFERAFPPGDEPSLVIKSINGDQAIGDLERLREAASSRPGITIMDGYLGQAQMGSLVRSADCVVSLHRSEGFGLTLADAMALGVPVIASDYGGNLEFMDDGEQRARADPEGRGRPGLRAVLTQLLVGRPRAGSRRRRVAPRGGRARRAPAQSGTRPRRRARPVQPRPIGVGHRRSVVGHPRSSWSHRLRTGEHVSIVKRAVDPARRGMRRAIGAPGGAPYVETIEHLRDDITAVAQQQAEAMAATERVAGLAEQRFQEVSEQLAGLASTVASGDELAATEQQLATSRAEIEATQQQLATSRAEIERLAADFSSFRSAVYGALDRIGGQVDRFLRGAVSVPDEAGRDAGAGLEVVPYMATDQYERRAPDGSTELGFEGPLEGGYRAFEDVFRGSEETVTDRLSVYVDELIGPVVDLGCGRGELLALLRERDHEAVGVDLDAEMVERCRRKGLDVEQADALDALRRRGDGTVGTIFSAQFLEHLDHAALVDLLAESRRVLRAGGRFIAETVNPHALFAFKTFWVDPTHRQPLFPEVLLVMARAAGFATGRIRFPFGVGDASRDRWTQGEYTLIAAAPG